MLGALGGTLDRFLPVLRWWWAPAIAFLIGLVAVKDRQVDAARKAQARAELALANNTLRVQAVADRALAVAVQLAATAEAVNRRINDETDRQARATTTVYRDRVMRIPAAAHSGGACQAGVPQAQPARSADSAGDETILVKRADALICADNTARIEKAHDWATKMIKAGQAEDPARAGQ